MAIRQYRECQRDTDVLGANVYFGNGQHCGTIWFNTVQQANAFLRKNGNLSGRDSGLCEQCGCHYSIDSPEHKKFPEFACKAWRQQFSGVKQN